DGSRSSIAMRRLRAPEQGAIDPIARGHVMFLRWAIVLGIVGLSTGFIGPIVLSPESNQGPLLGIFISGPAGTLLGAVLGALASGFALPPRTNAQILSVAAIALAAVTLYFC